jgi:NAD(P)-dependent dehydrogenase (short-subunit alcohol dehydrogenase family)
MKAALAHFTKNLAREFAADHIRANAVMPGMIESEAVAAAHEQRKEKRGWSDEDVFRDAVERYPLVTFADRFGRPEEVGDLVAFLASPRASYINGALVNIDGGSIF